jgi:DNA repair exonuclease SbcCD ATPase subunit
VRFAAKAVGDRIGVLEELLKSPDTDVGTDELIARHDALEKAVVQAEKRLDELNGLQESADLRWTEVSAAVSDRQVRYRQVFATRAAKSSAVGYHPVVRATIEEHACAVCHTVGVGNAVDAEVKHGNCPLCGSTVGGGQADDEALTTLRTLDAELLDLRRALEEVLAERVRLAAYREAASAGVTGAREALEAFLDTDDAGTDLERLRGKEFIGGGIGKLVKERSTLVKQAADHRKKRDDIRAELRDVEKRLRSNYERASLTFVPRFRVLAQQFIGLPIDVDLEQRAGAEVSGFRLRLTMDDQLRTSPERLSESQRFFIDIALRMALAESMTEGSSTLLIDTPEGSLDVAYEARAGQMFDTFAKAGNYIVMTANLRSSELLVNLGRLSGRDGMQLIRMTDWTELTEVQAEEEARLNEAYRAIEKALG